LPSAEECMHELPTDIESQLRYMIMQGRVPFILRVTEKTNVILRLSKENCKVCKSLQAGWSVVVGGVRGYIGGSYNCVVVDESAWEPYSLFGGSIVSYRWEPIAIEGE